MSAMPHPAAALDPLRFPLHGTRLIEASAGTGKTFTIAALYLRLVLGHGGEAGFGRPLVPPEILVVTFTDAATQELRDRIRARLAEAAEVFAADPPRPGTDLLTQLRDSYPASDWPGCARRLRLAAEWMDESAVSTIHGWCHRMLREHAFDAGSLFTQTLAADLTEWQAQAVADHWRCHMLPLDDADAAQIAAWWATPEALAGHLLPRLLERCDELPPGQPPAQALADARQARARTLAACKAPWAGEGGWAAQLQGLLEAARAAKHLRLTQHLNWLAALRAWSEGEGDSPGLSDTAWARLSPAGLAQGWKGPPDDPLLAHPAWAALADLPGQLARLPDGHDAVLAHAAHGVRARLQAALRQQATMGFQDLLLRLDAALRGPGGTRLAERIRAQFPVALIDEFQDTDPLQYRIFDTLYRVAQPVPGRALVLIGDPKQAIYAFRGADIQTYLQARADTAGRHATLGTNHRSSAGMVAAVNQVFGQAEQRPAGPGAFGYRVPGPDGHTHNPLPFHPVAAAGRTEVWVDGDAPGGGSDGASPALVCWCLPGADRPLGSGEATALLAEACASAIVALLQAGQAGRSGFRQADGRLRGVRPGDVAVLVASAREARVLRQSLASRGVRSVYLSDQDAVFDSPVVADVQRWLAACAQPQSDRLLRAALATATLGLDWATLDALQQDEWAWEQRLSQFHGYQRRWQRQGVLPMLRQLMQDFDVPARLLAAGDERQLTDLLHLAELLQQASVTLEGEAALLRWLAEQQAGLARDRDAQRLRLESDAALVKVITVHKSKGLEYPLVFLPFASLFRPVAADDLPMRWHDAQGRPRLALSPEPLALGPADDARLAEDLRKLYVALTRARHATWLGVVPVKDPVRSALGRLLTAGADPVLPPAALPQALQAWADACPAVVVRPLPEPSPVRFEAEASPIAWAEPPPLRPEPPPRWWVASYSALPRAHAAVAGDTSGAVPHPSDVAAQADADIFFDSADEPADGPSGDPSGDTFDEVLGEVLGERTDDASAPGAGFSAAAGLSLHGFPRGAEPGTFLHGLLEWAGARGFAAVACDPQAQREADEQVARRCQLRGWSPWTPVLQAWLRRWVAEPLGLQRLWPGSTEVAPAAFASHGVELEFWFEAHGVDLQQLDALVCRHTLDGAARPALGPERLNGLLKGFIDLVFEHEGRFYIADHKSNWLGPDDAAYHPRALRQAVLSHRYELQYVLYTLALHRLLRARLPGYRYEQHLGGVVYLFLRGQGAPGQGLHLDRPPQVLIEQLDALFAGEPTAPGTHPHLEPAP